MYNEMEYGKYILLLYNVENIICKDITNSYMYKDLMVAELQFKGLPV